MTRRLVHRLAGLLALTCALAAFLTTASPSVAQATGAVAPAQATETLTFGTQPATAGSPDERPDYVLSATPGAVFNDEIAIRNYSEQPLELQVYASDAFNTDDGGYDLNAANVEPTDIGTWVSLGQSTVTVPAREFVIVPFTVTVPPQEEVKPGDHSGGIVASLRTYQTDAQGNRIALDQRVGTRIHARISGELIPELEVDNIKHHVKGIWGLRGDIDLTYRVHNTGNIRLAGHQTVTISGLGVSVDGPKLDRLPELLPGNSYTVHTTVEDVPLAFLLRANVQVDPVVVTADDAANDPPPFTRSTFVWVWTWTLFGLLVVGLIALGWWLRRRRRQRIGRVETAYAALASQLPAGAGARSIGPNKSGAPDA